jgi:pyridoxal 5'-phosphate synthase pdxT subunit
VTLTPTVGVLALQGDVREHLTMLEACGARAVPVRRPGELVAVDGLVIPGGESTTIDKLLRAFDLFEPLRGRIAEGMPAFGSCAGMILLADRIVGGTADQQTGPGVQVLAQVTTGPAAGRIVAVRERDVMATSFHPEVTGDLRLHRLFVQIVEG